MDSSKAITINRVVAITSQNLKYREAEVLGCAGRGFVKQPITSRELTRHFDGRNLDVIYIYINMYVYIYIHTHIIYISG